MASVREIARLVGVSPTTVSRAINNHPRVTAEVRGRVLDAMNRSRYIPNVAKRSTTNIAFLYTGEPSFGSPFDGALMFGMQQGMEEHGYDLMVLNARRSKLPHENFTQMFARKGVRGVIVRTTLQTRGICQQLAAEGFPAVVVADRFDDLLVNYVYSDSREASRDAVEHLIGLGHQQIACAINIVDDADHTDRVLGYRDALSAHGIEFDERMVLRAPANREGGMQLLRRLMSRPDRPTAVFLTDPMTAVGLLNEARRAGVRVPEDLSVVGFDDSDLRYTVHPELTSVCQDAIAMGRAAFAGLHGLLGETIERGSVRKSLRAWLEIHQSTAHFAGTPSLDPVSTRLKI